MDAEITLPPAAEYLLRHNLNYNNLKYLRTTTARGTISCLASVCGSQSRFHCLLMFRKT